MKQAAWRGWESLRSGPRHVSKRRVDLRAPYPPHTPQLCYKTIASGTHSQTPSSTGIPQHARCEGHQVIVLYDPRNDQAVALHLGLGFNLFSSIRNESPIWMERFDRALVCRITYPTVVILHCNLPSGETTSINLPTSFIRKNASMLWSSFYGLSGMLIIWGSTQCAFGMGGM
jgi:hypothetical protein